MDTLMATTLRALMDHRLWNRYRTILTDEMFSNTNAAAVFDLIEDLHSKNRRNVTEKALRVSMQATVRQKARRQELTATIDSIMEVSKQDLRDAEPAIRSYAARSYCKKAASYWLTHRDDPAFDYGLFANYASQARTVSQDAFRPVRSSRQVGLPGDEDLARVVCELGYAPALDAALGGGIGRSELVFLLAPPKRGKTSYLISAATHAAKKGHHVAYFTLEIREYKVWNRYFQTLTHMSYMEMLQARELVGARRAQVKGDLYVVDCSMMHLTPSMVQAKVEELRQDGHPIDYVVIDYAELMYPNDGFGRGGATSRALGDMVLDIRRVAGMLDVFCLSAWQVNRGGVDKVVFGSTDISECWEVVKHADCLIGLNQGPQELTNNVMRMKVLEQRDSTARPLIYLHSDLTCNRIQQLEFTEEAGGYSEKVEARVESRNRSRSRVHGTGTAKGRKS